MFVLNVFSSVLKKTIPHKNFHTRQTVIAVNLLQQFKCFRECFTKFKIKHYVPHWFDIVFASGNVHQWFVQISTGTWARIFPKIFQWFVVVFVTTCQLVLLTHFSESIIIGFSYVCFNIILEISDGAASLNGKVLDSFQIHWVVYAT